MFDLSKFQKIAEDKDSTTLQHKDGHEMKILHSFIPKIQKEQLKRLKMAAGGPVNYSSGFNQVQQPLNAASAGNVGGGSSSGSAGFQKIGDAAGKGIKKSMSAKPVSPGENVDPTALNSPDAGGTEPAMQVNNDILQNASQGQQASANDAFNSAIGQSLAKGGSVEEKRAEREKNKEVSYGAGTVEGYHEEGKKTPVGKMLRHDDLINYKKSKGPNIKGLADGGEVESDDSSNQQQIPGNPVNIHINAAPAPQNPAVTYAEQKPTVQAPAVQNGLPNVSETGQPNPGNIEKNYQTIGQSQKDVDIAQGQANADREAGFIQATKQVQQSQQDALDNMSGHVKDYKEYINSNPISAEHFWQQQGTAKRVGAAFSIALGNLGSHGNPALEYINNQINRDMQSQIENSHNQKNILSAYESLYGKGVAANAATKATLLDLYTHKANQTAALLGTPQAKINAMKFQTDAAIQQSKLLQDAATQISSLPGYTGGQSQQPQQGQPGASNNHPAPNGEGFVGYAGNGSGIAPRTGTANAAPMQQDEGQYYEGHILAPEATEHFKKLQYTPKAKEDFAAIQSQFNQASQADKALADIDGTFKKLDSETNGISGRVHRGFNPHALGVAGAATGAAIAGIPSAGIATPAGIAGGTVAGEALGHGIKAMTNTEANRAYDSDKSALLGYVSAALKGTNIGSGQIQEIVDSNSPEAGDGPEVVAKKLKNIKGFIINHTDTSLLKAWGLSKR